MHENQLSYRIIGVALELHRRLGPGLLETAYEHALAYDLINIGLSVKQQQPLPFVYKKVQLAVGYRVDLIVENKVIVEVKSVEFLAPVHFAQLLTYLKLSDKRLGLIMNFNSNLLKSNIHRVVNKLEDY